jgi:uncharacterized membrane protein YgcG
VVALGAEAEAVAAATVAAALAAAAVAVGEDSLCPEGVKLSVMIRRLLLLLVITLVAAISGAQGFTIDRFHTSLDLAASGSMKVEERIEVTFQESKRGIFREIPVAVTLESGRRRRIHVDVQGVTDEVGQPCTTKVTRESGTINVRIGDADIYLPAGTKKIYVIRYSVSGMMNEHGAQDGWDRWVELYWNSFGSAWLTGITQAEVDIKFPPVKSDDQVRLQAFVGPPGSTTSAILTKKGQFEDQNLSLVLDQSSAHIAARRPLSIGEDLTIVLGLPHGTVAAPSFFDLTRAELEIWAGLGVPILFLVLGIPLWLLFGRDPWAGRIKVAFDPPDKLSPAHFGALIDEIVNPRDISAAVVGLAVKGYLRIHPQEHGGLAGRGTVTLEILEPTGGKPLSDFERKFHTALVAAGPMATEADLRATVAPKIESFKATIYNDLVAEGYYSSSPAQVRLLAGAAMLITMGILFKIILVAIPAVEMASIIIGGILSIAIIIGLARLMPRATPKGAAAKAHARGFATFLRGREHYMEWFAQQNAPDAVFEEYLPYAVALGIEAAWIKSFEGVLKQPPDWYQGYDPTYAGFYHSFGWTSRTLAYSAGTPVRESSSSSSSGWGGGSGFSGGSSGGGFGGGGGGSW